VFRRDLGSLTDAYTEVARRLGVMPQGATPINKPTLINWKLAPHLGRSFLSIWAKKKQEILQLETKTMKARVHVMLKNGVLDPQGEAVRHALGALGFDGVEGVRQGKVIELDLADGTTEDQVKDMCEKLLANTVIERYDIELG
jgi:phosphoribosylformylglycinamidine synthase PurS subunit